LVTAGVSLNGRPVELAIFVKQDGSTEREVAAVPEIASLDVFRCFLSIKLFNELCNRANFAGDNIAWIDVTVFRRGTFRLDTKRNDTPASAATYP
jgi:hypothetical protein